MGSRGKAPGGGPGGEAPGSSRVLEHIQCKILSKFCSILTHSSYKFSLELAQFPQVTARGESTKQTSERVSKRARNHYLYQACSRGDGYNLTRFGSPEPGLIFTYRKKVAWATKKWGSRGKSPWKLKGFTAFSMQNTI